MWWNVILWYIWNNWHVLFYIISYCSIVVLINHPTLAGTTMWWGGFPPFSSHQTPFSTWPGGVKPSSSCRTPIVSNAATQCSNNMTQCDNNTTQCSINMTQCGNNMTHSGSDMTNVATTQSPHPLPCSKQNTHCIQCSIPTRQQHNPFLTWNARQRRYILFYFPQPVLHPLTHLKCEMEVNFSPTNLAWIASPPLLETWDEGYILFWSMDQALKHLEDCTAQWPPQYNYYWIWFIWITSNSWLKPSITAILLSKLMYPDSLQSCQNTVRQKNLVCSHGVDLFIYIKSCD